MLPITMQTLLGLILFFMLLAPGASLKCETCTGMRDSCSGPVEECGHGEDACVSVWMQITAEGVYIDSAAKRCIPKSVCADLKSGVEHAIQKFGGAEAVMKKVECSKAPSASSGSLLLTLAGLLLLKLFS